MRVAPIAFVLTAKIAPFRMPAVALVSFVAAALVKLAAHWLELSRPVVKECRVCGATYKRATWRGLAFVGIMYGVRGSSVELRNCPCGSTLACAR